MISYHLKSCAWPSTIILAILLSCSNLLAHGWVSPKKAANEPNPVPLSQYSIDQGAMIFSEFCAYCHGVEGKGLSSTETKLKNNTPNLIKRLIHHSDGDFHWKIKNGKGEMPSFKDELPDDEIWDLINFIKSRK